MGGLLRITNTKDRESSVSELVWIVQTSAGVHLGCTCAWLVGGMVTSVDQRDSFPLKMVQERKKKI